MAVVFVAFLVIGIAMPVLPLHVHDGLGQSTFVVGLVAGSQFAASLISGPMAGHSSDTRTPKRGVIVGLLAAEPIPRADMPGHDLVPHLLATSDVLGTGWYAAAAANVRPGSAVAVVGDGAVGLMGVLAAKEIGAERIIAISRHKSRQALAREFGATDVVAERGAAGVERVKELTGGVGADSVLECVGTQEPMT
jgi:MFS family permease